MKHWRNKCKHCDFHKQEIKQLNLQWQEERDERDRVIGKLHKAAGALFKYGHKVEGAEALGVEEYL